MFLLFALVRNYVENFVEIIISSENELKMDRWAIMFLLSLFNLERVMFPALKIIHNFERIIFSE